MSGIIRYGTIIVITPLPELTVLGGYFINVASKVIPCKNTIE
jgi:hypothetical protein